MNWTHEQQGAIRAVHVAATLCQRVRRDMVQPLTTLQKKDRSPVTVADFASQAVVGAILREWSDAPLVAEEDAAELRHDEQRNLRELVVGQVRQALDRNVDDREVLDWIDLGRDHDQVASIRSFWTLDPIDGTKGFLRGEQYAIALARIEEGQVVFGVLGCPALSGSDGTGVLLVARHGSGSWIEPMSTLRAEPEDAVLQPVRVCDVSCPAEARICESVESGHSRHDHAARIANLLGIQSTPLRMDSQAKYAAVARGDASIYLRLPTRPDYREKIWDHAAGFIVVQEAGGQVTDASGAPLDFSCGAQLERNRGVVATNGKIHSAVLDAVRQVV